MLKRAVVDDVGTREDVPHRQLVQRLTEEVEDVVIDAKKARDVSERLKLLQKLRGEDGREAA